MEKPPSVAKPEECSPLCRPFGCRLAHPGQADHAPAVVETLERLGGEASLDWGGALIWYRGSADSTAVRAAVPSGVVTLARPGLGIADPAFVNRSPGRGGPRGVAS